MSCTLAREETKGSTSPYNPIWNMVGSRIRELLNPPAQGRANHEVQTNWNTGIFEAESA